ncbi:hypothetical protein M2437_003723 [Methylorubrum pseudosasae]|nr:hypothetical protein [Methylorubrum pseudosasae]
MFEVGQWHTPTPAAPRRRTSSSLKWMPVGEPSPPRHPADLFEVIDRALAERLQAEGVLVASFAEMGVKRAIVALGQHGALAHQPLGDGEGGAGGQPDPHHRAGLGIMEQAQHPLAVGEDRVVVLHQRLWRKAASLLRQAHRATGDDGADTEAARLLDLNVDGVLQPLREQVVVVARRGAAGQEQLGIGEPRREPERLRRQPTPDPVERLQPRKKRLVDRRRMGPRQRLEEVVMRVDEPGDDDVPRGVERLVHRRGGLPAGRHPLGDAAALDDDAPGGSLRQDRERIAYPEPPRDRAIRCHADS